MLQNYSQGKDHKVVATQESTAQNSTNQGKLFGTFTEDEIRNIVDNSNYELVKPGFVINYLKQAEKVLDRARMSDENKNFIKGAFQMMAGFGAWNTKEKYEYLVQRDDPDDVRQMIEDGDEEGAVDALVYEIGCIVSDLQNDDELWFPEEEVEEAREALKEYASIIQEHGIEDGIDDWTLNQMNKVLNEK